MALKHRGVSLLLAIGHLVSVALVALAMLRIAVRFFRGTARVAIAGAIGRLSADHRVGGGCA